MTYTYQMTNHALGGDGECLIDDIDTLNAFANAAGYFNAEYMGKEIGGFSPNDILGKWFTIVHGRLFFVDKPSDVISVTLKNVNGEWIDFDENGNQL